MTRLDLAGPSRSLRAGTGVTVITPPLGMPLAGHFEYREAATVVDDLTARALVLDDSTTRIALISCDLIRVPAWLVALAREQITRRCGIPGDHVMIAATHTHTGPVISTGQDDPGEPPVLPDGPPPTYPLATPVAGGLLSAPASRSYLEWVAGRIADSVAIACTQAVPARIAIGATDVEGICFNRRFLMRDGTVVFNPGIKNPDIVESAGPTDPQVTALLVEDLSGSPIALWANLSLHYVGTDDPLAVSADYFGQFARQVSRFLGDSCIGFLSNGASGDINNIDVTGAITTAGMARGQMVATAVAAAAVQATAFAPRAEATLATSRLPFQVRRCTIADADVALAERILAASTDDELPSDVQFSFVVGQPIPAFALRTYAHEVLALAHMPDDDTTEIQVIRIGELGIVALPGEIFVALGLAIKQASPFAHTAVVGLANDHIGYVPTIEAVRQGGYETWRTRLSWSAPGTGEEMVAAARGALGTLVS